VKRFLITLVALLIMGILPCLAMALDKTGLVLYMNFDEGGGKTAKDLSGKGNNGELKGDAKWVKGKINGGINLGAIPDRVDVADSATLDIEQNLTLGIWANVESIPNSASALFMKPTAYMLHQVPVGDSCQIDLLVFVAAAYGPWPTPNVKAVAKMNEWHHYAVTYDGKKIDLFIDGKRMDGYDRSPNGKIDQDNSPLTIGRDTRPGCDTRNSPCTIDEVMVWSRALSEAEIKEAMNGSLSSVESNGKLSITWGDVKNN
jgi:hypothetical protein